jgi:hypothetical protein
VVNTRTAHARQQPVSNPPQPTATTVGKVVPQRTILGVGGREEKQGNAAEEEEERGKK